ncbi:MAG TPA: hypothetical protein VFD43_12040, partial [Planctomycetota bacterium]|nr:hypothetical protein [Planctomycetota bacterium]
MLLACEGLSSLVLGRSLLRRVPGLAGLLPEVAPLAWLPIDESQRALAGASNPGLYRLDADPLVGYTLRADAELTIGNGRIRSDALGLRSRPSPAEPKGALRIAVVGASIPFGHGLDDDETIAHRLEQILTEARGPEARPIVCRTVAMGRWSACNASQFLLDHWIELAPDIVLYMPFINDLSDTDRVDETGQRRSAPDPTARDPWLCVGSENLMRLRARFIDASERGVIRLAPAETGADALLADLSPESSWRYDRNAACLLALSEALGRRHGRLALLVYTESDHDWHLLSRLQAVAPELAVVPLLRYAPPEFRLPDNYHPHAETARVLALWIAEELLARGWVDRGAGRPLPPTPEAYSDLRARPVSPADVARRSQEAHERDRAALLPAIDLRTGYGFRQVLGGLDESGIVGSRMLVLLAPAGEALELQLAPIEERPDLYPLDVRVEVDGLPIGTVTLTAEGPAVATLTLPARAGAPAPI